MSRSLPTGARVLMIRMSALGDVLFALETVASLAAERPDVVIDFVVDDRFASLLDRHPQLDQIHVYPRRRAFAVPRFLLGLRRTRYWAVLDLHGIQKSALVVRAAAARHKLGYARPAAREGSHRAYHEAVELPDPLPHRAARGPALLRALGLHAAPAPPVLAPPVEPIELPAAWREPGPRVLVHPGTSAFASFKRWPVEHFGKLAARIGGQVRDARVVVSHGPGEAELAAAVARATTTAGAATPPGIADGSALGLLGMAELCRHADVVVAADTGPLHLAATVGTPTVALFGPKDPALYGPRGDGHIVLFHDVPCRPCRRRRCASPQCVLGIQPAAAQVAVQRVLAATPR